MSEARIVGNHWARLSDDTTWPLPDVGDGDLSWRLTYGTPSRRDLLRAVSIINAYGYLMLNTTQQRRAQVVREIRELTTTPPTATSDPAGTSEQEASS